MRREKQVYWKGRGQANRIDIFSEAPRWRVANSEQQPRKRLEHPLEVEAALAPSDIAVRTSNCFRRNPDSMRRGNEARAAIAADRQRDVVVGGVRGHRTRAKQVEKRQPREP